MQAALRQSTATAAFTSSKRPIARSAAKLQVVRATQQSESQWKVQRRSLAGLLAAAPVLFPATRALALLPDDDDEELVERAKANRKARLEAEKEAEKEFKRTAGYVNRDDEKELIKVQKAVNGLAKSGSQLEAGDLSGAAATLSAGWAAELRSASETLSSTEAAKSSAATLLSSLASLEASSKANAREAKQSFVAVVGALQQWVDAAGIAGSIKGL